MPGGESILHSRPTRVDGMEGAVAAVLASGRHAGGDEGRVFAEELAGRVGLAHGLALASGFAGLHIGLLALGLERGARVLLPSYACGALLNAISAAGAVPLLADVDPTTFNLTPEGAASAIEREGLSAAAGSAAVVPHIL
ncbi:MAG: DegT/DnrJ/EryC1/StrS family aminotransferase, partial [Planctomycetota bacterium]